jgi:hypothetical protein
MTNQSTGSGSPEDRAEAPGPTEHREPDTTIKAPNPEAVPDPEEGPPPEGYGGPTE